jgi:hypothetical protein
LELCSFDPDHRIRIHECIAYLTESRRNCQYKRYILYYNVLIRWARFGDIRSGFFGDAIYAFSAANWKKAFIVGLTRGLAPIAGSPSIDQLRLPDQRPGHGNKIGRSAGDDFFGNTERADSAYLINTL